MFEAIERLKADWTDKHVVIDSRAPELARFAQATGIVKTVNMNGRCLVEFEQFNNTGWYDIDPTALKIVPKPVPKPAEAKPKAAATAATAKPAAARKAAPEKAVPAAGKRPSTADILAAARAKKAAAGAEPAVAEPEPAAEQAPEPVVKPAKAKAAAGPLPTTTAEKIAWCRTTDAQGS